MNQEKPVYLDLQTAAIWAMSPEAMSPEAMAMPLEAWSPDAWSPEAMQHLQTLEASQTKEASASGHNNQGVEARAR